MNRRRLPPWSQSQSSDGGAETPEGNWEKGVKNSLLRHVAAAVVVVVAVPDTNGHFDRRRNNGGRQQNRTCNIPGGACI